MVLKFASKRPGWISHERQPMESGHGLPPGSGEGAALSAVGPAEEVTGCFDTFTLDSL
jgi:hypothetical protein